jgi:hypothetical protein
MPEFVNPFSISESLALRVLQPGAICVLKG